MYKVLASQQGKVTLLGKESTKKEALALAKKSRKTRPNAIVTVLPPNDK